MKTAELPFFGTLSSKYTSSSKPLFNPLFTYMCAGPFLCYNSEMAITTIWQTAVERGASDIHILSDQPVFLRIDGGLSAVDFAMEAEVSALIRSFLSAEQQQRFLSERDLDSSYAAPDGSRFRINCHYVGGKPALAIRLIPNVIPSLEGIAMPQIVIDIARQRDGMMLFTGPTGSGKSTSLASIIQALSMEGAINIITLEDPIEFPLAMGKGIIQQRELGRDFHTFPDGLKHVLRQDPDVIMVGEMRDLESIALALTLAETGHLVLATLHTANTYQAIDRIVDVFPAHQQAQIRLQLSLSLKAVVAQRLLPKRGGGRIANREILLNTPAVANMIRTNRIPEICSALQTSANEGMVTFDADLKRLMKEGGVEGA